METKITMRRTFTGLANNDSSSSAFNECNRDISGEFPSASSQSRQLWLSCVAGDANSTNDLICQLVSDLASTSIDDQKQASMELRLKPLVRALRMGMATAKENAACALLRLSQNKENKAAIGRSGAIPLLVNLLEIGGIRGKKDASMTLYLLCSVKKNKLRARPESTSFVDEGENNSGGGRRNPGVGGAGRGRIAEAKRDIEEATMGADGGGGKT